MKILHSIIFSASLILLFTFTACAQTPRLQRIFQSCANSTTQAEVKISDGNIYLKPCPTKKAYYNSTEIGAGGSAPPGDGSTPGAITSLNGLTDATQTFLFGTNDTGSISSTGTVHTFNNPISAISGTARTGFFPYFDGENTLGKSYVQQATNQINVFPANSNSGLFGRYDQNLGSFYIGDNNTNTSFGLHTGKTGSGFSSSIDALSDFVRIGEFAGVNPAGMRIDNINKTTEMFSSIFSFDNESHNAVFNLTNVSTYNYQKTLTAAGTTTTQTINKPAGTINIAASANSVSVNNSTVTATSIIVAVAQTNDATCAVKNAIPGSGSFVVNMTATCTAETKIGFQVLN